MIEFSEHAAKLFETYSTLIKEEARPLIPDELFNVNHMIDALCADQVTSYCLESPVKEGVALLLEHFRTKFRLPTDSDFSNLLGYTRSRQLFVGLNPDRYSREPKDIEFLAFGHLATYQYALNDSTA